MSFVSYFEDNNKEGLTDIRIINHYISAINKYWSKIITGDKCWGWKGSIGSEGYPYILMYVSKKVRKNINASKLSYFIETGEWIERDLIHCCKNRLCTNPNHLQPEVSEEELKKRHKQRRKKANDNYYARIKAKLNQ